MTDEREKFFKKLKHLGEEDVRQKHGKNHFGPPDSKTDTWAQEWLKGKDKEAQAKETREKETQSTTSISEEEKPGEKDQPEFAPMSPEELNARRKKAIKTVVVVGLISLLIFSYVLFSGT